MLTHLRFQVWEPSSLICVRATRLQVSARAAYPTFTVQGRRGEGRQGPLLPRVLSLAPECLYFLFLFEKFFLFKPPWSKQAPGCSQLSLALSQESCSSPCAWAEASAALVAARVPGPGDLIVLKHSSYRQIFQSPLSLVSDLRICWNTVGCSLCSSDQLGISLALRGSGLPSHLCCRHLPHLMIYSFIWAIYFLSWCTCYIVRGGAIGIHQGGATHIVVLWCCMWGRGPRGNNVTYQLSAGFQSCPPLPTSKLSPSGADSLVGGFVYILGPCWSLQSTLL